MESSASLPHHTPTSSSPPHCPPSLLCQSYRGSERAVEFDRCIRIDSGRLSTPTLLYCRAGVVFQSSTSTLSSRTAASHQFLVSSCHPSSLSSPRQGYHEIISPSPPPKTSIVCRARLPSNPYSIDNATQPQVIFTRYLRAVDMVCWK